MALKRPRERTVNVDAAVGANPCDITFQVDENDLKFDNNPAGNNPKPGYIVYFDIVEPQGLGCTFHAPDPMWVQPVPPGQNGCPVSPCHWDQFRTIDIINHGKTLMVRNENDYQSRFAFTLRFDVAGCPGQIFECDPIGNNQNGQQE